jgi:hypothetical protein
MGVLAAVAKVAKDNAMLLMIDNYDRPSSNIQLSTTKSR